MYILYIFQALKLLKPMAYTISFLLSDYDYAEDMYSVCIGSSFGKLYL